MDALYDFPGTLVRFAVVSEECVKIGMPILSFLEDEIVEAYRCSASNPNNIFTEDGDPSVQPSLNA
jgi:hypothetical protein